MKSEDLKSKFKYRDRVATFLDEKGLFRVSIIKNTQTAKDAQSKHNLSVLPAYYLTRLMTASSLISSLLKGEERIILETDTDGAISKIFAESMHLGETRGFIRFSNDIDLMSFKKITDVLGKGFLKVSKILYNKSEPINGIVELIENDIATDLSYYFAQSEQIPTYVVLETDFNDDGLIIESGGFLIQVMPGATENDIKNISNNLDFNLIREALSKHNQTVEDIANSVLPFKHQLLTSTQIDFFCRCSKEKFMEKLVTLNLDEIKSMQEENHRELVCQYCNAHYNLDDIDFVKIIEEMTAKLN